MNADEAVKLCKYVKACCPQQAIDEYTPLAWADHLEAYPYADAKDAAKELTAKQPFVTVAELLVVIKRVRNKRIADFGDPTPPAGLTEPEERAWLGEARRRIANGEHVEQRELGSRGLDGLRALMPKPEPVTVAPGPRDPAYARRLADARAEVGARSNVETHERIQSWNGTHAGRTSAAASSPTSTDAASASRSAGHPATESAAHSSSTPHTSPTSDSSWTASSERSTKPSTPKHQTRAEVGARQVSGWSRCS